MNREQKTAVVDEIAGQIQAAEAIFAVDYRGITVSQVADLRARLQEANAKLRVVKNSLSERAADQAGTPALKPMLEGPTALALVHGDAALAAKALNDTARALNILEFKGGLMNGTALSADDVRSIARLPSRDVLNAQLVGTIAAPLSGLVRGLNALIAGVAIQLQALVDQGLVSGVSEAQSASEAATRVASDADPASEPGSPANGEPAAEATAPEVTEPEPASEGEPEGAEALAEAPVEAEAAAKPEAVAPAEPLEVAAQPPGESEPEPAAEAPSTETQKSDQDAASDAEQSDA